MLPGLLPPETPPRLSWVLPGIQNGTGRTGQKERRGKSKTANKKQSIRPTGRRRKKGNPELEKGKRMIECEWTECAMNENGYCACRFIIEGKCACNNILYTKKWEEEESTDE